jgi:hypothetical protein
MQNGWLEMSEKIMSERHGINMLTQVHEHVQKQIHAKYSDYNFSYLICI